MKSFRIGGCIVKRSQTSNSLKSVTPQFQNTVLFNCIKQSQNITLSPGRYIVEAWGASGGNSRAGKGAYVKGTIQLNVSRRFYIFIGEKGNGIGVFNANRDTPLYSGVYGGGSTDLRLENGEWDSFPSRKSRILVAAAGGGDDSGPGGDGGALIGLLPDTHDQNVLKPTGGTQISGGAAGAYLNQNYGYPGKFGIAGSPLCPNGYYDHGGGGGNGYYGGGGICVVSGGAGGSSFISGHKGCNAIREDSTENQIIPTDQPVHFSNFVFTDTEMIPGNEEMPAPNGNTEIGHQGSGFMRITNLTTSPFSLRSLPQKPRLALKIFLLRLGLIV